MHRATPINTSFRAFTAGGARSCVDKIDDAHFMQEMAGNFMAGEARKALESPQNYGFTSVVADAEKDANGLITACAEAFITFCGGNRSFPVAGIMDDRRHRLMGLEKGDTAMFRQRDDAQQFHMTKDGGFWSGPTDKTVRMQLVDKQQQQQQSAGQHDASGGGVGGAGGAGGQGQKQMGQKPVYKDGKDKSYRYVDVTDKESRLSGTEGHIKLQDQDSYVHCVSKKTYLGGHASKHQFARVLTEDGPASNVYGRVDGGGLVEFDDDQSPVPFRAAPAGLRRAVVPVLMLALGLSLGVNYRLVASAVSPSSALASACFMASR